VHEKVRTQFYFPLTRSFIMFKANRRFLGILSACTILALSATTTPSAQAAETARLSPDAQSLLDTETKRFQAQVQSDVAALKAAIADDAVYIHANGVEQYKNEYLSDVAAGKVRWRSFELNEQAARILGDVGLTHGMMVINVGVDRRILVRTSGVYVKRGGEWQLLSWQSTPVPESK
jgi:Domain of unknown function (DUF4440)